GRAPVSLLGALPIVADVVPVVGVGPPGVSETDDQTGATHSSEAASDSPPASSAASASAASASSASGSSASSSGSASASTSAVTRSEAHTSELQSPCD